MPDPRAVPEGEVRERMRKRHSLWALRVMFKYPEKYQGYFNQVGIAWDGTQYLDTEGSQE